MLTAPPFFYANFCCSPLSCPVSTALCGLQPQLPSVLSNYQLLSWSPATNFSAGSCRQLSFASPYHFRIRRDFFVQESFVWFRAKTDSSALAAYPHSATPGLNLNFLFGVLISTSPTHGHPLDPNWSRLGETKNRLAPSKSETQLTAFFQIPQSLSASAHDAIHVLVPIFLSGFFIVTSLIVTSTPLAREHLHSTNSCTN